MIITCPECKERIAVDLAALIKQDPKALSAIFAARGGAAGRGKAKARTTAQARKAGLASAAARKKAKNIALNGKDLRRKPRTVEK